MAWDPDVSWRLSRAGLAVAPSLICLPARLPVGLGPSVTDVVPLVETGGGFIATGIVTETCVFVPAVGVEAGFESVVCSLVVPGF